VPGALIHRRHRGFIPIRRRCCQPPLKLAAHCAYGRRGWSIGILALLVLANRFSDSRVAAQRIRLICRQVTAGLFTNYLVYALGAAGADQLLFANGQMALKRARRAGILMRLQGVWRHFGSSARPVFLLSAKRYRCVLLLNESGGFLAGAGSLITLAIFFISPLGQRIWAARSDRFAVPTPKQVQNGRAQDCGPPVLFLGLSCAKHSIRR